MTSLTLRQREVLDLLIEYQRKHGFPPTTYELTGMLGCRSPNYQPVLLRDGAVWLYRKYLKGQLPMKQSWNGEYTHDKELSGGIQ
ncbi:LexA family protein [Klebsiella sp. CVUAS 11332]|uniref:LexA family protein n=1 Tax=Klebsiella sp. CVUAS 11332 TaxID=2020690 RepID=UPI001F39AD2A|nr:hypothetical protein [Klebsiella sp. CVUAS 11332]MBW6033117.1 hypothetical protein [Klebsiella sp. CVUAS 11332]